ncbi:MAG: RHS repeat-associated core domain-containing protein [Anaerolineales bacterium]
MKSVSTTNIATTTTYFVGAYYEVANGLVTKYYYAGSQRIAMRANGDLKFLLGDHLGSTSLVTDANGQNIIETRYTAWGEVRYSTPNSMLPTKFTFTGQYSYQSDFGLMFFNARWVDVSLGRFAQADTIIPGGVQGYDRYAYTNNNPVKYFDPSGHCAVEGDDDRCSPREHLSIDDLINGYGVQLLGDWDDYHKKAVLQALYSVGSKFSQYVGGSASSAFQQVYGTGIRPLVFLWNKSPKVYTGFYKQFGMTGGGVTIGNTVTTSGQQIQLIAFLSMSGDSMRGSDPSRASMRAVNNIVHELGHLFGQNYRGGIGYQVFGEALTNPLLKREGTPTNGGAGDYYGFGSQFNVFDWQQAYEDPGSKEEIFADMFLGWTFDTWYSGADPANLDVADARSEWMTTNMEILLTGGQ